MWSKILPVLLLLWALTGAFYPAIDLCAGEKERGTLETLLSSPAERSEIVLGKLLTIMLFSIVTAVLNLLSMGITGWLVLAQLPGFGLPPPTAIAALARGLAADLGPVQRACAWPWRPLPGARKEGQYYLMPLLLITMPLVVSADVARRGVEPGQQPDSRHRRGAPAAERAGGQLLAGGAVSRRWWRRSRWLACLLAIRWAVDQFNSESVLFRESERLDVGLVAAAPAARPAADADGGRRGRVLRRADPAGQFLPELSADDAERFRRLRPRGPDHATGGDCRAGAADDDGASPAARGRRCC